MVFGSSANSSRNWARPGGAFPNKSIPGHVDIRESRRAIQCSTRVLFSLSNQIDPKDPAARRAVVIRPPGMDAGITTDQGPVMHRKAVRVGGIGQKVDRLEHLTVLRIVLYEFRPVIAIAFAVVSNDLPNGAIVPRDRVISRFFRRLIER